VTITDVKYLDVFNGENFLDFLKKLHRKFGRLYLFLDKARQHRKTSGVSCKFPIL
jgi:hypothetical protein